MKKKILLILGTILMATSLISCSNSKNPSDTGGVTTPPDTGSETIKSYNISYENSDFYDLNVSKTAKENENVTVTISDVSEIITITDVLYNDLKCNKDSNNTNLYTFIMPNKDVFLTVNYTYQEKLIDGYSSFDTKDKTIYPFNENYDSSLTEKRELLITFDMSYMTILEANVKSSNESVIPNNAITVKKITQMDLIGASGSNTIVQAKILIDSHKIKVGKTFLIMNFKNGNVSSEKSTLVVEITVQDKN